jgi:hypothetical protein
VSDSSGTSSPNTNSRHIDLNGIAPAVVDDYLEVVDADPAAQEAERHRAFFAVGLRVEPKDTLLSLVRAFPLRSIETGRGRFGFWRPI